MKLCQNNYPVDNDFAATGVISVAGYNDYAAGGVSSAAAQVKIAVIFFSSLCLFFSSLYS